MPKETRNKKHEIESKGAETETVSSSLDHVIQLITSKTEEIQNSIAGKLTEEIRKLNGLYYFRKNQPIYHLKTCLYPSRYLN